MATFALVHGSWHRGWSWDLLVPELEAHGHRAVRADYPEDRADSGWEVWAAAVAEAIATLSEPPVLVGTSLGGAVAALVGSRASVRLLVYLCASTPFTERPLGEPKRYHEEVFDHLHEEDGFDWWEPDDAVRYLYTHVDPDRSRHAAERLLRAWDPGPYPLARSPDVPSAYIYTTEDEFFTIEGSRWAAENLLGVEPIVLPGGHYPQFERPAELGEILSRLASDTPDG